MSKQRSNILAGIRLIDLDAGGGAGPAIYTYPCMVLDMGDVYHAYEIFKISAKGNLVSDKYHVIQKGRSIAKEIERPLIVKFLWHAEASDSGLLTYEYTVGGFPLDTDENYKEVIDEIGRKNSFIKGIMKNAKLSRRCNSNSVAIIDLDSFFKK